MKVLIQYDKSLQENAAKFYEKAKKSKKKLTGLEKAILDMEKRIERTKEKKEQVKVEKELKKKRVKKWFENFHWFYSSDKFLILSGRDAKSNEVIVKKHMDPTDVYFHAEIFGAPHTIIKTNKKEVPKETMVEAAQFAGIFSRSWKHKIATIDVYSVKPEQVSKKAPTGESIGSGAFMIYGKRNWFRKIPLEFAVGVDKSGKFISGPKTAIKAHSKTVLEIEQGDEKTGSAAKKIKKILEEKSSQKLDLDEIISMLPAGGVKIIQK